MCLFNSLAPNMIRSKLIFSMHERIHQFNYIFLKKLHGINWIRFAWETFSRNVHFKPSSVLESTIHIFSLMHKISSTRICFALLWIKFDYFMMYVKSNNSWIKQNRFARSIGLFPISFRIAIAKISIIGFSPFLNWRYLENATDFNRFNFFRAIQIAIDLIDLVQSKRINVIYPEIWFLPLKWLHSSYFHLSNVS